MTKFKPIIAKDITGTEITFNENQIVYIEQGNNPNTTLVHLTIGKIELYVGYPEFKEKLIASSQQAVKRTIRYIED